MLVHKPIVAALGLAVALFGPAHWHAAAATPEEVLNEAAEFRTFRLYHAGPELAGHPLTDVSRGRDVNRKGMFSFIYGDCMPDPDPCRPPYELQLYRSCSRNASSYPPEARGERTRGIRGATIYEWKGPDWFDRLEVYTGKTTIVIWAPNRRSARQAVAALRSADGRIGPEDRLRPPARGSLAGRLRC